MIRALRRRLAVRDPEAGLTLIELMVAVAMSVTIVGAATAMLISAVRTQPEQSKRAQNITTARYQLDRLTRELRNGVKVTTATPAEVSLVARVRRVSCGGSVPEDPDIGAIQCQITYACEPTYCTRVEAPLESTSGQAVKVVTGIDDPNVFCFVPSSNEDPTECGPAQEEASPTYIGVVLHVPNPSGEAKLTISDGASLRTATFYQ
jgi:Tfp pilus assembly protein PilV